jgi:hypothetical protein
MLGPSGASLDDLCRHFARVLDLVHLEQLERLPASVGAPVRPSSAPARPIGVPATPEADRP